MNILVTGAAGYIGGEMVKHLCGKKWVDTVVGTDINEHIYNHPKYQFEILDIRESMDDVFASNDIDTVVHAAYVLPPIHNKGLMEDINKGGTENVLQASAKAGVKQILYTSSTTAYGFYPDNDQPLTEESPLRGNGDMTYAKNKKEIEAIIEQKTNFIAVDGPHFAEIKNDIISLQMIDVDDIQVNENSVFMYTGTQHHVAIVGELDNYPVFKNGREIRNSYENPGSNVNFVQQIDEVTFRVRTYEKGVEDETLACGTGVTAVAIAMHKTKKAKSNSVSLPVEGGNLEVSFNEKNGIYTNVFLKGLAEFVFKGTISL